MKAPLLIAWRAFLGRMGALRVRWSCWSWLGLAGCLAVGCAAAQPHVDQALLADKGKEPPNPKIARCYTIGCPDVLEIAVAGRPELSGRRTVDPAGRILLPGLGRLRVEGQSVEEAAGHVAEVTGLPDSQVHVRVVEFQSQQIYLFGQVSGLQRAVPYQGQETVLELLQRTGGITAAAAPDDVYVVRSHLAQGRHAEVFHVDLRAVVMKHNQHTNLRLQPFDQVYIGETDRGRMEKCVAPCLRPLYEMVCGMQRPQGPGSSSVPGREPQHRSPVPVD